MCGAGAGANGRQVAGDHYRQMQIQHWDLVVANGIPYLDAQVLKYVMRHAAKNGKQDLEKAAHFLQKMIEVYYGGNGAG
jgi:FMN-dependent NADH-azoreductase